MTPDAIAWALFLAGLTLNGLAFVLALDLRRLHQTAPDANREQRAALRRQVRPLLDRYRANGDETELRATVRQVMGQEWQPNGTGAEQIRALGGEP